MQYFSVYVAAEHLLERDFKHYAFYCDNFPLAKASRYTAFCQTIEHAGYRVESLSWLDEKPQNTDAHHHEARKAWLQRRLAELPKPIGLLAFNDQQAAQVIEACLDEFIAVPNEVAVIGMLDMDMFRYSSSIALSSVRYDFEEITKTACDLLDQLMDGQSPPSEPILFPPQGVSVRESTDTLAAHHPVVSKAVRFMLAEFGSPIDIDRLIEVTETSRRNLFKAFRADMNCTPIEALVRIRIERAKRMLTETDAKVYAVAKECGFGEAVNMHRAFIHNVGQSPGSYRKQHRR